MMNEGVRTQARFVVWGELKLGRIQIGQSVSADAEHGTARGRSRV
jgi:hypothetical protein